MGTCMRADALRCVTTVERTLRLARQLRSTSVRVVDESGCSAPDRYAHG